MVDTDSLRADLEAPGFWSTSRVLVWLAIGLVLWAGAVVVLVADAQGHARAAEGSLRRVATLAEGELADVDFTEVEVDLAAGNAELDQARDSIDRIPVQVLGFVPVVGRQIDSATAIIHTSDDLADSLQPLVSAATVAQEAPNELDRVEFLADAAADLRRVQQVIRTADLGPDQNLAAPLADARAELAERLAGLDEDVTDYQRITAGLAEFFGDSTYLVLGANNAEMQIGGGMHLSVGTARILDGDFELPGLTPAAEIFPVPRTEVVDADVEANWGFVVPGNDFRKLQYSPRFAEFGGPQAAALWESETGEVVDGVLAIDPFVLQAILEVVGEVEVEGEVYDADGVLQYLLLDQYAVFDDGDDDAGDLVDERRDRLSLIANAAVEALSTSAWDPIQLVESLRPMARGRHLAAWSPHDAQQQAWTELGVAGHVPVNATAVTLSNEGGAKLDPYLRVDVTATTEADGDEVVVDYEIVVRNTAPTAGLPRYTVGPWRTVGLDEPGTWFGRLAVSVPGYATDADVVGSVPLSVAGADGEQFVFATSQFAIGPGDSVTRRFAYRIPAEGLPLELLPSARFPAAAWTWNGRVTTDSVRQTLD